MTSGPVSPELRAKLVKVLARLGSDHDGERAAAGLLASRLLRGAGLTWEELLNPPAEVSATPARTARPAAESVRPAPAAAAEVARFSFASLSSRDQRRVLSMLLKAAPLAADDRAFCKELSTRLYREPHRSPRPGELGRVTRLWRAHAASWGMAA